MRTDAPSRDRLAVRMRPALTLALVAILTSAGCSTLAAVESDKPELGAADDTSLEIRLSEGSTRHISVTSANRRLTFHAHAPDEASGRYQVGVFTRSDPDDLGGGEGHGGKDNVVQVLYERGLTITEKRWNPAVIENQEQYGAVLEGSPRAQEYLHSQQYAGITVWYHDVVALEESVAAHSSPLPGVYIGSAEVWWFVDGVSYMIGAPDASAQELLTIAEAMLP